MAPKISSDRAEASRRYYEKNAEAIKAKQKARRTQVNTTNRARNLTLRDKVSAAKAQPCADCGVEYPYYVMDFDHVRGEKVAPIARMVSDQRSWTVIQAEIDKCEVVCANCHRSRTYQRGQVGVK